MRKFFKSDLFWIPFMFFIPYGIGAFYYLDFDCSQWSSMSRFLIGVFWFMTLIVIIAGYSEYLKKSEKKTNN